MPGKASERQTNSTGTFQRPKSAPEKRPRTCGPLFCKSSLQIFLTGGGQDSATGRAGLAVPPSCHLSFLPASACSRLRALRQGVPEWFPSLAHLHGEERNRKAVVKTPVGNWTRLCCALILFVRLPRNHSAGIV